MAEPGSLVPLRVTALRELADVQAREGSLGDAIVHLTAGLDVLGERGARSHPDLWRLLVDRLAWVRFRQGMLDEAVNLVRLATAGLDPERADDPMTLASLYNTMGGVLWQQGNLPEATTYVKRSLSIYERLGYLWGMANAYSNLGILDSRLGNWPEGLEHLGRALDLRRRIGDIQHQAFTLNNLGFLRTFMGQHETARQDLEKGLALGQRLGDNWIIAQCRGSLAYLAVVEFRFADAEEHAQAALSLAETAGSCEVQVQARWVLALVHMEHEEFETGMQCARDALQMAHSGGLLEYEADCLRVMGLLHTRTGGWLEAEARLHESIETCRERDDPYREGLALLELGRTYQRLAQAGDLTGMEWQVKALTTVEESLERFERLGAAYDLRMARKTLAQVLAETEDSALSVLPEPHARTKLTHNSHAASMAQVRREC
jgi:tetratricopeptide (TPR) repeat protein